MDTVCNAALKNYAGGYFIYSFVVKPCLQIVPVIPLALSVKIAFTFTNRGGRKYKCDALHLFHIRLNVVTGSSNQPWAFYPHVFFFS